VQVFAVVYAVILVGGELNTGGKQGCAKLFPAEKRLSSKPNKNSRLIEHVDAAECDC
jgi:hypothetical protein